MSRSGCIQWFVITRICAWALLGVRIWSGPEAKSPVNHIVVVFQLIQISLNVHPEVSNNQRLFGVWETIFKRSETKLISTASALLSANFYLVIIR